MKSNDPSLWIMAAKWEFEDNGSAANGRGLLLRALRFHPESIQLYTEVTRSYTFPNNKILNTFVTGFSSRTP